MISRAQLPCVTLLLVTCLISGCSSSQMSRIDADRALYESWPLEMQQAVLDGKAVPGMTRDMVRMALGQPTEIVTRAAGISEDEIWIYRKGGDEGGMGMGNPGVSMGGSMGGINVGTGGGMGTTVGTNMGMGSGINMGTGMSMPLSMPAARSAPAEEREVIFQDNVVLRADAPP